MDERKQRLIALLNTPPAERKGTSGYLVDKWHAIHEAKTKLDSIVSRKELELNEARTQQVKAAGAVEAVEAMLLEFDAKASNAEQPAPPLPPPLPVELPQPHSGGEGDSRAEELRRKAQERVERARGAAAAAGAPALMRPVPTKEGDAERKGEPS